ncbi:MAG: hypothetical protein JSS56_27815, partial [Proteobacteria bacterium]|nr:hypothetical protein [Pseudomonadota bacterium]
MRLGRLPHSEALLAAFPRHFAAAPPPPSIPCPAWAPKLVQNDTLPTCTVAGLCNDARAKAAAAGFDPVWEDQDGLAFYAALAGCDATLAAIQATDGLDMLAVLDRAGTQGFRIGASVHAPVGFGLDVTDRAAIASGIASHQAVYLGVDLTQGDMLASGAWTDAAPGPLEGGHCILAAGYTGLTDAD